MVLAACSCTKCSDVVVVAVVVVLWCLSVFLDFDLFLVLFLFFACLLHSLKLANTKAQLEVEKREIRKKRISKL